MHQHNSQKLPEPQQADSADQALGLLARSPSSQLTVPHAATAPHPSPHIPHVVSVSNPLLLPAQSSRPQSAQLQQTLPAMSDQLSTLEESCSSCHKTGQPALLLILSCSSVQSAEVDAMADTSQQGMPSCRTEYLSNL